MPSLERFRALAIVAHVDHGKSTLADRMLELCGAVDPRPDTSSPVVPYDGERFHLIDILKRGER